MSQRNYHGHRFVTSPSLSWISNGMGQCRRLTRACVPKEWQPTESNHGGDLMMNIHLRHQCILPSTNIMQHQVYILATKKINLQFHCCSFTHPSSRKNTLVFPKTSILDGMSYSRLATHIPLTYIPSLPINSAQYSKTINIQSSCF